MVEVVLFLFCAYILLLYENCRFYHNFKIQFQNQFILRIQNFSIIRLAFTNDI